jgi:ribose transport system substrate-binding protein
VKGIARMNRFVLALCCLTLFGTSFSCNKQESSSSSGGGGSSASTAPSTNAGTAAGHRTIAVIPKGTTHVFWKSVEAGAKKAGSELGVTINWQGPLKEDDRGQQIGLVEQFISNNVNGIVLAPLDATALQEPVAAANAKHIPVVIFDSPLNGEAGKDFVSLVATDNRKGGQIGGEELARLLNGKGKVVLLRYGVGSASTEAREAGFLDAMAKHPDIQIIEKDRYAGATVGEAQQTAENLLDKLKQADGIFASNESATQGMLNVVVANGLAGKVKFVGFDTSPSLVDALKNGQLQALVAQNPRKMGYLAVKTMVDHLDGKQVPTSVDTGCALVTKENLDTPDIKALLQAP